ncbi:MAG TPA: DUF4388 domain-containing protein [Polyangiaceae bacterium]|jgi:hypothetical protein|nr:DUF4388 domain-containing protein [Polyangiaceae bacterium]
MSPQVDVASLDEDGFRVSLHGATLPDFVQMECLAQSNRVFRITSGHRIGYLFFAKGQIIHALSGDHVGEPAALEILKWRDGSVEPCNVGWPDAPTIRSTWQNMLMLAAQARDESGRHKLVALPSSRTVPPSRETTKIAKREEPSMNAPPSSQSLSLAQFQAFVRLDAHGNVVSAKGDSEELAPIAAYAARLAELIGDMLGMEGFASLECSFAQERVFLHRERSGNLVGLKVPVDAEVAPLRERFGI